MAILGHICVNPERIDLFLNRMHDFFTVHLRKTRKYEEKNAHNPNPRDNSGDLLECPDIFSDHSFSLTGLSVTTSWLLSLLDAGGFPALPLYIQDS